MATLGDYIKIKHGYAFKGDYISTEDNGIVLVTPGNFNIGGGFKEQKCKFFTSDYPQEYVLKEDDLIVTMTDLSKAVDTLGYSALVPKSEERIYLHNQRIGLVQILNSNIDKHFLYWFMRTPSYQKRIAAISTGSTVHHTSPDRIGEVEIDIPELEAQKRIANCMDVIDKKIKINEKINRNLEEQLTAVYNEWFGMYKPYNIGIGGDPNYELDAGWKVADIYSIANIIYGAPFASKLFNIDGEGIPIVRIRDLKNQELVTYTTEKHPKGYLIKHGDIVVGMDGEFRPYIWGNDEAWLNQRVCIFDNKREMGKAFLYCTIKPLLHSVEATELATTVIHIGKKDFDEFRVVLPPEDMLARFESLTNGMYNKIVECQVENRRLAQLRDSLLPKLMSGELDVFNLDI